MRPTDPSERRQRARNRRAGADTRAPGNPTYGMQWWDPSSGVTKTYVPPGIWRIVSGGSAEWNSVTGKPTTFPPTAHTHTTANITNLPAGAWVIPTGITDPNVVTALNNLRTLLQSVGIIT